MRRLVMMTSLLGVWLLAPAASAGGSVWEFEGYHQPGDLVESTTAVAWGHNPDLGTPEDGPYFLYLAPAEPSSETWPQKPEEGLLVGIVEVREGAFTAANGDTYGPHHAVARFEIPDVPVGTYQVFHCNDPCTTTLGDIIGGWDLRVLAGSDGRPAEDIADEVRAPRTPTEPLLIPASEGDMEAASIEAAATEPAPSSTVNPNAPAEQPVRLDRLWLSMAGIVSLLVVMRIVRTESDWSGGSRRPRDDGTNQT